MDYPITPTPRDLQDISPAEIAHFMSLLAEASISPWTLYWAVNAISISESAKENREECGPDWTARDEWESQRDQMLDDPRDSILFDFEQTREMAIHLGLMEESTS